MKAWRDDDGDIWIGNPEYSDQVVCIDLTENRVVDVLPFIWVRFAYSLVEIDVTITVDPS